MTFTNVLAKSWGRGRCENWQLSVCIVEDNYEWKEENVNQEKMVSGYWAD
jgi:hypothetical protein